MASNIYVFPQYVPSWQGLDVIDKKKFLYRGHAL